MQLSDKEYDDLKKRGFLRSKDEYFTLRTRMPAGNFYKDNLVVLARVADKYGRGFVHLTVRQGMEIPFIKFQDIEKIEKELNKAKILRGTSGARLRATTSCPGNNWCKRGLVNTFSLFERIENELGIKCAMDLPHKFKIVISGCPNTCTRAQASEIGVHGAVDFVSSQKTIGYTVYLGGCGGNKPKQGIKLNKIFTEDEVLKIIQKTVVFFHDKAKPRQRLSALIEEVGQDVFLREIDIDNKDS